MGTWWYDDGKMMGKRWDKWKLIVYWYNDDHIVVINNRPIDSNHWCNRL